MAKITEEPSTWPKWLQRYIEFDGRALSLADTSVMPKAHYLCYLLEPHYQYEITLSHSAPLVTCPSCGLLPVLDASGELVGETDNLQEAIEAFHRLEGELLGRLENDALPR